MPQFEPEIVKTPEEIITSAFYAKKLIEVQQLEKNFGLILRNINSPKWSNSTKYEKNKKGSNFKQLKTNYKAQEDFIIEISSDVKNFLEDCTRNFQRLKTKAVFLKSEKITLSIENVPPNQIKIYQLS